MPQFVGGTSALVGRSFEEASSSDSSYKSTTSTDTPLAAMAEAFEELSRSLQSKDLRLAPFCSACALVSVLFSFLGFAFKFAEAEYVSKVHSLLEASKTYDTLNRIIDHDVEHNIVRTPGSHARNLRRVRQGLGLIQAIFEEFLTTNDCSLRTAASTAYSQVCAPYHTWTVRKAVFAGMYALPTRDQLIAKLKETDFSVGMEMRRYIEASRPIINYIDDLYISRDIKLDW
ncbi:Sphingosine Transfer Protein [Zostera marina]|uniref:Sphingosine Transfer Protein n=1 Tax=Zostera marina TaxID=29655 RepID=A0A0K9Q351_ZOSMR|nr:Sphingosine Transfer Protein [Zostera marina]